MSHIDDFVGPDELNQKTKKKKTLSKSYGCVKARFFWQAKITLLVRHLNCRISHQLL